MNAWSGVSRRQRTAGSLGAIATPDTAERLRQIILKVTALTTMRDWPPSSLTTDTVRSYPEAIERLKRECKLSESTRHRKSKYLNNIIEADHGVLKHVIRPTGGFRTMKTATATIRGFEIMRMILRGHCLTCRRGANNEVRFVNSLFGIAAQRQNDHAQPNSAFRKFMQQSL